MDFYAFNNVKFIALKIKDKNNFKLVIARATEEVVQFLWKEIYIHQVCSWPLRDPMLLSNIKSYSNFL